jgi:hypothetical protein
MMGQANDELDSSDDEDHFPPSQVFDDGKQGARQGLAGELNIGQSKATKFDKLLKVSENSEANPCVFSRTLVE